MFDHVLTMGDISVFTDGKTDLLWNAANLRLSYRKHQNIDSGTVVCAHVPREPEEQEKVHNLMLRLLITNRCNLDCSYCQMKKLMKTQGASELSYQHIDRILDTVSRQNYNYVTIHFSGGEPLMALDQIVYICESSRMKQINNVRFAISTNGVLLTDHAVDVLRKYDVQTVVSIDGIDDESSMRRNKAGASFVKCVLSNAAKAREKGLHLGVSTVFIKGEQGKATNFVETLSREYAIDSLGFNYQHYSGFEKSNIDISDDYMDTYADTLIQVSDLCRERNIFEEQSNRIIEPFVTRTARTCHCTSQSSQVTVMPSGILGPCKTFASDMRDVVSCGEWCSGSEHADNVFSKWRGRRIDSVSECAHCVYRAMCGGGCPYEAFVDYGTIYRPDLRYCIVVKKMFLHLLELLDRYSVFASATEQWSDVKDEQRKSLLTCTSADKLKLTASIGHFLED